jgi:phage terminase large subunit-like protein
MLDDPSPWSFACPDWEARLREGRSLVPELPLNAALADQAAGIFDKLRLPDVPGQPELREAAGPWFRDMVRALFGSLDAEGKRRAPEIFGLVPKKNSKTSYSAGLMITALLMNQRPKAEFLLVGPTQEIAELAFAQASGMIEADPEGFLGKRFHVREHIKAIKDRRNGAVLKVKTFDMKVMTGAKPAGVLLDELHIMSGFSYAARVLGQIRGGLIPNPEAFLVMITTQSDQPPAGVFRSELHYARAVRDGRIAEPRMLPVLYEFPEAMQTAPDAPWRDPANWPMVLPNIGRSISLDRLVADWRVAKDKGDDEERRWASQHLNVEIGLALHSDRWRGADFWEAAGVAGVDRVAADDLEDLFARSEVAVVGIDGGGMDDLLGLAVLGRCAETKRWLLWTHAWCWSGVLELRKEIAPRLTDLAEAGDLTICEDVTQDVREVAALCARVKAEGLTPEKHSIGVDAVGISAVVDALAEVGIGGEEVVGIPQGYRLAPAVWGAERKLADGTLIHYAQPLNAWCVGNAKAEQKGNAVLITKEAAGKAKIDPLIAAFNAFQLMARNPTAIEAAKPELVWL